MLHHLSTAPDQNKLLHLFTTLLLLVPITTYLSISAMKIARITNWGSPPSVMNGQIRPPTTSDKVQVKVLAVGISQQVRNRAASDHPVTSFEPLPFDPSVDGVVQDEITGDIYYVLPRGARLLDERVNVSKDVLFKLPRNFDPVKVAGLAGPWLTSWAMLLSCTKRKVLIIGVTSCEGRAAVMAARWIGASAIIGLSYDEAALAAVPGLTIRSHIGTPVRIPSFQGIDIVIDFIGGETGVQVLDQINNIPNNVRAANELKYMPAWGPRAGPAFVLDAGMMAQKNLRVIDPSLSMWRLATLPMREKLRFGVQLMGSLKQPPYEIVAKPMLEVESVWDEEDFKSSKKMLVLVPSKMRGQGGQQPVRPLQPVQRV